MLKRAASKTAKSRDWIVSPLLTRFTPEHVSEPDSGAKRIVDGSSGSLRLLVHNSEGKSEDDIYIELQAIDNEEDLLNRSTANEVGVDSWESMGNKKAIEVGATPIPRLQIVFWVLWRSTHPLFFGVILPFINNMLVEDIQVADEAAVGIYSGIVESVAAFGNGLSVLFWSFLSDRIGRKPVALLGVGLGSMMCAGFGFGKTYATLVALRFCLGVANSAQAATVKVMVSEKSDQSNNARCFACVGFGWQAGATLAPLIGAWLANPASTWPEVFSFTLFDEYPYALPGLVVAVIPFVSVLVGVFLAEETSPKLCDRGPLGSSSVLKLSSGYLPLEKGLSEAMTIPSPNELSTFKAQFVENFNSGFLFMLLLWVGMHLTGNVITARRFILTLQALLLFQTFALASAELLLFYSSAQIGGLALTRTQISLFLGFRPLLLCVYELLVYPRLVDAHGTEKLFRILVWLTPLVNVLYLILSATSNSKLTACTVMLLGLVLLLQVAYNPLLLTADIIILSRATSEGYLSTANAISTIVAQAAVALGTAAGSSLFSVSMAQAPEHGFWRSHLVWLVLIAFNILTALISRKLTAKGGWQERRTQAKKSMEDELD